MKTLNENLDRAYNAARKDEYGHEMDLALDAIGFFHLGHGEGNIFHEGLYRMRYGSHEDCESLELFCSEYLFEREFEIAADMKTSDFWELVCEFETAIRETGLFK